MFRIFSIQTGCSTGFAEPGSIFRCRMTFSDPFTSASTSSVSTVPAWPASAANDGLPRVDAVFSR